MMARILNTLVYAGVLILLKCYVAIHSTRQTQTTMITKTPAKDASFDKGNKFLMVVPIFM